MTEAMTSQQALAEAVRRDELQRREKVGRLVQLAYAWGWDAAVAGCPKWAIAVDWDEDGNATIRHA